MNINATLFAQAVVFAILVWFTMKFVWPPIAKALDERALKISEGLAASEKAKSELAVANKRVEAELRSSEQRLRVLPVDREFPPLRLVGAYRNDHENPLTEDVARVAEEAATAFALRYGQAVARLPLHEKGSVEGVFMQGK